LADYRITDRLQEARLTESGSPVSALVDRQGRHGGQFVRRVTASETQQIDMAAPVTTICYIPDALAREYMRHAQHLAVSFSHHVTISALRLVGRVQGLLQHRAAAVFPSISTLLSRLLKGFSSTTLTLRRENSYLQTQAQAQTQYGRCTSFP
jgi:hypothetical protein